MDTADKPFVMDISAIRKRARQHMEKGAVTDSYKGDLKTVLQLLNEALATELVCVLRYKSHFYRASGLNSPPVAQEFKEHAREEELHMDKIAERIQQLGGEPNFSPEGLLMRSHSEYSEGENLKELIQEDLVAERIAIESYAEMIRYINDKDPTTRRLLEEILEKEEEHADDLVNLLKRM